MPNIRKKLDQIAQNEGRTIEEIIREAIAEWLRARDS
jgi:predicted transcriptional regulator